MNEEGERELSTVIQFKAEKGMNIMKNRILTVVCAAALSAGALAGVALAKQTYTPGTGVSNSPHNINNVVTNGDEYGRVCAYCHTPHHAIVSGAIAEYNPLWSHQVNEETYTPYASRTFDGGSVDNMQSDPLVGPSRLCMSCHDGVIAVSQHYGTAPAAGNGSAAVGDNWNEISVGDLAFGEGLTNDHPIGFDYDAVASTDKGNGTLGSGIKAANTQFSVTLAGTGVNYAGTHDRKISDLMYNNGSKNIMTCASCHDVHNNENPEDYLLINKQAGSQICLTCHKK